MYSFGQNFEKKYFFRRTNLLYIVLFEIRYSNITGENRFQIDALVLKLYAKNWTIFFRSCQSDQDTVAQCGKSEKNRRKVKKKVF